MKARTKAEYTAKQKRQLPRKAKRPSSRSRNKFERGWEYGLTMNDLAQAFYGR